MFTLVEFAVEIYLPSYCAVLNNDLSLPAYRRLVGGSVHHDVVKKQ